MTSERHITVTDPEKCCNQDWKPAQQTLLQFLNAVNAYNRVVEY